MPEVQKPNQDAEGKGEAVMKFESYRTWKKEWKEVKERGRRVLPMLITYVVLAAAITVGIFAFGNKQQDRHINSLRSLSVYGMAKSGSYNHYDQVEAPWSSSYRLTLYADAKAILEGWAIILNRSNHDWVNVRISVSSDEVWHIRHDFTGPLSLKKNSSIILPFLKSEVTANTLHGIGESNAPKAVEIINTTGEPLDAGTVEVWEEKNHGRGNVFSLPITRAVQDMFFGTTRAGDKFMLVLPPRKPEKGE